VTISLPVAPRGANWVIHESGSSVCNNSATAGTSNLSLAAPTGAPAGSVITPATAYTQAPITDAASANVGMSISEVYVLGAKPPSFGVNPAPPIPVSGTITFLLQGQSTQSCVAQTGSFLEVMAQSQQP
jgi:hypothetical protein